MDFDLSQLDNLDNAAKKGVVKPATTRAPQFVSRPKFGGSRQGTAQLSKEPTARHAPSLNVSEPAQNAAAPQTSLHATAPLNLVAPQPPKGRHPPVTQEPAAKRARGAPPATAVAPPPMHSGPPVNVLAEAIAAAIPLVIDPSQVAHLEAQPAAPPIPRQRGRKAAQPAVARDDTAIVIDEPPSTSAAAAARKKQPAAKAAKKPRKPTTTAAAKPKPTKPKPAPKSHPPAAAAADDGSDEEISTDDEAEPVTKPTRRAPTRQAAVAARKRRAAADDADDSDLDGNDFGPSLDSLVADSSDEDEQGALNDEQQREEELDVGTMSLRDIVRWGNARDRRLQTQEDKAKKAAEEEEAGVLEASQPQQQQPVGVQTGAPVATGAGAVGGTSTEVVVRSPSTAAALALALPHEAVPARALAPQVQLINGRIVVNQQSLTVQAQERQEFTRVVTEDNPRLNSSTYMNRLSNERWTVEDTELFYKALSQFGTDFTLICQLFPGRQRRHLKNKYTRENKLNPDRVDGALRSSSANNAHHYREMIETLKASGVSMGQDDDEEPGEQELRDQQQQQQQQEMLPLSDGNSVGDGAGPSGVALVEDGDGAGPSRTADEPPPPVGVGGTNIPGKGKGKERKKTKSGKEGKGKGVKTGGVEGTEAGVVAVGKGGKRGVSKRKGKQAVGDGDGSE